VQFQNAIIRTNNLGEKKESIGGLERSGNYEGMGYMGEN